MENSFLTRKANGEKILISELLAAPPSDEGLATLFPYSKTAKPPDDFKSAFEWG